MICYRCAKNEGQVCLMCLAQMTDDKRQEVDEKFVKKWERFFEQIQGSKDIRHAIVVSNLSDMLREAGVKVKEEE